MTQRGDTQMTVSTTTAETIPNQNITYFRATCPNLFINCDVFFAKTQVVPLCTYRGYSPSSEIISPAKLQDMLLAIPNCPQTYLKLMWMVQITRNLTQDGVYKVMRSNDFIKKTQSGAPRIQNGRNARRLRCQKIGRL